MQHIEQIVEHIAGRLHEITREDLLWGGMGVAVAEEKCSRDSFGPTPLVWVCRDRCARGDIIPQARLRVHATLDRCTAFSVADFRNLDCVENRVAIVYMHDFL